MPDLTTATEIAAKGVYEDQRLRVTEEWGPWESLGPSARHSFREAVLPAVAALAEAGLLKEDQS